LAGITELAMFLPVVMRCSKFAILALTPHWSASGVLAALIVRQQKFDAGNAEEDRRGVTHQGRRSHFVKPATLNLLPEIGHAFVRHAAVLRD
jgi:hypothetical protein